MVVSQYLPELHGLGVEGCGEVVEIISRYLSYTSTVKPGKPSRVPAQGAWHIQSNPKGLHYNHSPGPNVTPTYP